MRIRTYFVVGFLVVLALGISLLLWWLIEDLKPQYRKATEEPLVEISRLLASAASETARRDKVDIASFRRIFDNVDSQHPFAAKIFDHVKTDLDLRIYITDAAGTVLFDSYDSENEGRDFSRWNDVYLTLRGGYGARTSSDPNDPATTVMYVAAPIHIKGKLAGVLTVGKPTRTAIQFVERSKRKILIAGGILFCAMMAAVLLLSNVVTTSIYKLTSYAHAIRDGRKEQLPALATAEVKELGSAFEEMRNAVEGRYYIEKYVQTLTHELKSPLAAIRGAAELLREEMPPEQRERFLSNVRNEAARINTIVEQLLLLSSLETRKEISGREPLDLTALFDEVSAGMSEQMQQKNIRLTRTASGQAIFDGAPFLIRQAVANLLLNAVEFSPSDAEIRAEISADKGFVQLVLTDSGPGIPEFALDKVFDRFYSLQRPDTGRKSSGLGLSLVREIILLHGGDIAVTNVPGSGAMAVLRLPISRS